MRLCRLWRHLKILKRAGVGLNPDGVASAKPGSCAIECPACPNPKVAPRPPNVFDAGIGEDIKDKSYVSFELSLMRSLFVLKVAGYPYADVGRKLQIEIEGTRNHV